MYKYETHLHTSPVSRCAYVGVEETLSFYKFSGYDGVFITNHFVNGNLIDEFGGYNEALDFYFSDYEKGVKWGEQHNFKVFLGIEISYRGTDFLVYGLEKQWYYMHPEIMDMKMSNVLRLMAEEGALIIQAHPFREAGYIDHIRLFPRCIHGTEVINACRTDFENEMAVLYAKKYELLEFAGSDNHIGGEMEKLAGMQAETPITDELDFTEKVKDNKMKTFYCEL